MHESMTKALAEAFVYIPETGEFLSAYTGRAVGWVKQDRHTSYLLLCYEGRLYRSHRVAWLIMTGGWPLHEIDHIDRNGLNNRFSNLRDTPHGGNSANQGLKKNNTSGFIGVSYNKKIKAFIAHVKEKGRYRHLGVFQMASEAARVRDEYAKRIYGEFASLNFKDAA